MTGRGHEVTIVGPDDPNAQPSELPPRYISLPSIPLRNHPGFYLAMPSKSSLEALRDANFDMLNTVHMPSVYNVLLPDALNHVSSVNHLFEEKVMPWVESNTTDAYNAGDALVCLSPGLKRYWREHGVEVPIHVIPRAIETRIFDETGQDDPFAAEAKPGARLLVVCRHAREKEVDRLLRIFAQHVYPRVEGATLTLVGDGPESEALKELTKELGIDHRTHFVGEQGLQQMPAWFRHADLFVYTSLSETYGQVISEALWCGLPVVAMVDPTAEDADSQFGGHIELLLTKATLRCQMSEQATRNAKRRSDPEACVKRYLEVFEVAKDHAARNPGGSQLVAYRSLARWAAMHSTVAAMGLMRKPVELNRNHAATGTWTISAAS
ncbi:MAG: glycosyltransferase [Deltaproteobacteria bacterium]|nr:glycosyltransferase [Deltaproteobacteria bacterium]